MVQIRHQSDQKLQPLHCTVCRQIALGIEAAKSSGVFLEKRYTFPKHYRAPVQVQSMKANNGPLNPG